MPETINRITSPERTKSDELEQKVKIAQAELDRYDSSNFERTRARERADVREVMGGTITKESRSPVLYRLTRILRAISAITEEDKIRERLLDAQKAAARELQRHVDSFRKEAKRKNAEYDVLYNKEWDEAIQENERLNTEVRRLDSRLAELLTFESVNSNSLKQVKIQVSNRSIPLEPDLYPSDTKDRITLIHEEELRKNLAESLVAVADLRIGFIQTDAIQGTPDQKVERLEEILAISKNLSEKYAFLRKQNFPMIPLQEIIIRRSQNSKVFGKESKPWGSDDYEREIQYWAIIGNYEVEIRDLIRDAVGDIFRILTKGDGRLGFQVPFIFEPETFPIIKQAIEMYRLFYIIDPQREHDDLARGSLDYATRYHVAVRTLQEFMNENTQYIRQENKHV